MPQHALDITGLPDKTLQAWMSQIVHELRVRAKIPEGDYYTNEAAWRKFAKSIMDHIPGGVSLAVEAEGREKAPLQVTLNGVKYRPEWMMP